MAHNHFRGTVDPGTDMRSEGPSWWVTPNICGCCCSLNFRRLGIFLNRVIFWAIADFGMCSSNSFLSRIWLIWSKLNSVVWLVDRSQECTRHSKVANLYVAFVVDENVSRLDVTMDYMWGVHILDSTKDVIHDDEYVVLSEIKVLLTFNNLAKVSSKTLLN